MFVQAFLFVKSGNNVAWVWLKTFFLFWKSPEFKASPIFFLDSKWDSATSIIGCTLKKNIKKLISKLMYHNDPLPLCLWWIAQTNRNHVHKTKHHMDVSGSKLPNNSLSSSQGLAVTPPSPKRQKTLHRDHYFNTLCALHTPRPLPPLQRLSDHAKFWSIFPMT